MQRPDIAEHLPIKTLRLILGVIACIGILATLFTLLFGFTTIPANSVGVKTRFGAYHEIVNPGLAYAIPYIDEIYVVPTQRLQKLEFGFSTPAATNIRLYEFSPHLHARGKSFKYEAIYPNGHVPASEVLLSVPYYEFNWQTAYRLAQPKDLPAGTVIRVTAHWDNSIQNADLMALYNEQSGTNPNWALYSPSYINHPEYIPPPYNCAGITFDQQTWDEMFIGYFSYAVLP